LPPRSASCATTSALSTSTGSSIRRPQEKAALYTAGYGMHERGSNEGWHRKRSYLVAARTHPVRTLAGAGATTLALVAVRATRR
jgi:hypothetical protein